MSDMWYIYFHSPSKNSCCVPSPEGIHQTRRRWLIHHIAACVFIQKKKNGLTSRCTVRVVFAGSFHHFMHHVKNSGLVQELSVNAAWKSLRDLVRQNLICKGLKTSYQWTPLLDAIERDIPDNENEFPYGCLNCWSSSTFHTSTCNVNGQR